MTTPILNNIHEAFSVIGTTDETILPAGKSSVAVFASEYAVAHTLFKLAKKRLDRAEKLASAAGLLGDDTMYITGEIITTWKTKSAPFSIVAKKGSPWKILDKDLLLSTLIRRYDNKIAQDIVQDALKDTCEPVTISVIFT